MCLSEHFLNSQITNNGLVPRGGICTSCSTYVLWGDIIRGCYRRMTGGAIGKYVMLGVRRNKTKRNQKTSTHVETLESSSEGEHFDLDVSSTEESG